MAWCALRIVVDLQGSDIQTQGRRLLRTYLHVLAAVGPFTIVHDLAVSSNATKAQ